VRGSDSGFRSSGASYGQNHVVFVIGYNRLTRREHWSFVGPYGVRRGRLRETVSYAGNGQIVHFVVEYNAGARRYETAAETKRKIKKRTGHVSRTIRFARDLIDSVVLCLNVDGQRFEEGFSTLVD